MLRSKILDRVCCVALAVMLALTAALWTGVAGTGWTAQAAGYEDLFDQSRVHTIEIKMDDWEDFISTATGEEYAEGTVIIDGEKLTGVAIRAKGNTSLSSVATMGSEKYSLKIEFDHFVEGRLYHGLDKLSLNNLIYDATMMKDYLAYTLMAKEGVPSPLCSFVEVTVNGEVWGLYLAVEGIEDSFMDRNNMTKGELYKPDSMSFGGGRGNGRDFDFEEFRKQNETSEESSDETSDGEAREASAEGTPEGTQAPGAEGDAEGRSAQGGFSFSGDFTPPSGFGQPGESSGFQMPEGFGDFSGFGTPPEGMGDFGNFQMPEGMGDFGNFRMPEGTGDSESTEGTGDSGSFTMPSGGGFGGFGGFGGMGSNDVRLIYTDDDPDSYANIFDNAKTDVSKRDKARLIEALSKLNQQEDIEETVFTDEVITYLAVHDFLCNGDSYTGTMVHNYYLYEEDGQLAILPWDYNLSFGGFQGGSDATSEVNSPIDSPVSNGNPEDRPLIAWIFSDETYLTAYHEAYDKFISEVIESGWLAEEIARVAEMIRPYVESDPNGFFDVEEFDQAVGALQSFCALRGESIRGQLEGEIPSTTAGQRTDSASLVDGSSVSLSDMGGMNRGGSNGNGGPGTSSDGASGGNGFGMPGGGGFPGNMSFGGGMGFGSSGRRGGATQAPAEAENAEAAPAGEADGAAESASDGDAASMPSGEMPSMSDGNMPSMPSGEMPSMPSGEMPSMSDGNMPSMPDGASFPGNMSFGGGTGDATPEEGSGNSQSPVEAAEAESGEGAEGVAAEDGAEAETAGEKRPEDSSSRSGRDRGERPTNMPSGFSMPGQGTSGGSRMPLWQLLVYAGVILVAILVIWRVPSKNR